MPLKPTETKPADSLYRVDRFVVPEIAREAFLQRLAVIRDFLAKQSGCLFNRIAESHREDGFITIMTIVEWSDRAAMENARTRAKAFYAETGFDSRAFMLEHGIDPEFGLFVDIRPRSAR